MNDMLNPDSSSFDEIMVLYNKNNRDYNDNIRMYLEIMRMREQRLAATNSAAATTNTFNHTRNTTSAPPVPSVDPYTFPPLQSRRRIYPIHTNNEPRQNNLYNYTAPNPFSTIASIFNRRQIRQTNLGDLEDVVVYPTNEQINRATEVIVFNSANSYNNITCPITLEPFIHGEHVCKIKHCSHIFKRDAIINWFTRNVRCPVCRYDIRDYVEDSPIIEEPDNDETDENFIDTDRENDDIDRRETTTTEDSRLSDIFTTAVRELLQEQLLENASERNRTQNTRGLRDASNNYVRRSVFPITQNFTSSIRNFITNEISQLPLAAELLYTFDIPIVLDISNNRV